MKELEKEVYNFIEKELRDYKDNWKDFAEEARKAATLERTIERILKEREYVTKKEVEDMFVLMKK